MTSRLVYITDDWHFRFVFDGFMPDGNEKRVQSFADIIESMNNYYHMSGGRVLAHGILYLVLTLPKAIYNVLNSVCFVGLFYLIQRLSFRDEGKKILALLLTFVLMLLFLPSFGDTCLWTSGATNYLWMALFPLVFLVSYQQKRYGICMVIAVVSGFTNEATGGMMIVFCLSYHFLNKLKLRFCNVMAMICFLPGMLFVLCAPGNGNRAAIVNQTKIFSLGVMVKMLFSTFIWLVKGYYLFLIFFVLIIPVIFRKELKRFLPAFPYLVASLAGMAALAASGTFFARAQFLCVVLLLISFLMTLKETVKILWESKDALTDKVQQIMPLTRFALYAKATGVIAGALVTFFLLFQFWSFVNETKSDLERIRMVEKAVSEQKEEVTVQKKYHFTAGIFYPQEASVSREYEALWMGLYYGIKVKIML